MKKYNRIICWTTKTHKKLVEKTLTKDAIFVDSVDDIDQGENDIVIISISKVANNAILEKVKGLKDPYYLEKKGWFPYRMTEALWHSKNKSMIGTRDMDYIRESNEKI